MATTVCEDLHAGSGFFRLLLFAGRGGYTRLCHDQRDGRIWRGRVGRRGCVGSARAVLMHGLNQWS